MTRETVRGFASGLLIAAIVLGVYYLAEKETEETSIPLSALEKASKEYGYELKKIGINEGNSPAEVAEEPKDKPVPTTDSAAEPAEKLTAYTIRIEEGTTANQIGQMLKENGIIDDSTLFTSYMESNDLSKKVQIGNFEVTKGMTIEEIAHIITN